MTTDKPAGFIEQIKNTLVRRKMPSSWEQVERHHCEIRDELDQARKRTDTLTLIVRGMRRKEDWSDG